MELTVTKALKLCKQKGGWWLPNGHHFIFPDNEAEVVEITTHKNDRYPYKVHYRYSSAGKIWRRYCRADSLLWLVEDDDAEES
jgi:hypothetical protein